MVHFINQCSLYMCQVRLITSFTLLQYHVPLILPDVASSLPASLSLNWEWPGNEANRMYILYVCTNINLDNSANSYSIPQTLFFNMHTKVLIIIEVLVISI